MRVPVHGQLRRPPRAPVAPFASHLLIFSDGGFTPTSNLPVDATIPWRLDSARGLSACRRRCYVRLLGGESGPETYQDDIILDETRPEILSATARRRGSQRRQGERRGLRSKTKKRRYRLRINARDKTSGRRKNADHEQEAQTRQAARVQAPPRFRTAKRRIHLRVQNGGGNFRSGRR